MSKRYIDADEARITYSSKAMDNVADLFNKWLDIQPTADVVEVVRCPDCKYYKNNFCFLHKDITIFMRDDDYCSYGERAEQ